MTDSTTVWSDKEKEAVNLNVIEERMLTKTINSLNLEKSYVIKLMEVERKQVKFGQKRMRNKVKAIKTHLEPTQIAEMKTMEIEGTFKPEYTPMNASGILRILAASKRLKLMTNSEVAELVDKDLKRPLTTENTTITPLNRAVTPAGSMRVRSQSLPRDLSGSLSSVSSRYETKKFPIVRQDKQSISGSMYDLRSQSRQSNRPQSRMSEMNSDIETSRQSRPTSRMSGQDSVDGDDIDGVITQRSKSACSKGRKSVPPKHVLTTRGFLSARPNTVNVAMVNGAVTGRPPKTPRPKTSLGLPKGGLNYSSHKFRSGEDRCRRESVLSTSSIGSDIAREKAAEFRKELLNDEQSQSTTIEDRRQMFLTRISSWMEHNTDPGAAKSPPALRRRATSTMSATLITPRQDVDQNENDIQEKEKDWASIRKCRYLRQDDDEADLSGVTTLVKDQLKQLQGFGLQVNNRHTMKT